MLDRVPGSVSLRLLLPGLVAVQIVLRSRRREPGRSMRESSDGILIAVILIWETEMLPTTASALCEVGHAIVNRVTFRNLRVRCRFTKREETKLRTRRSYWLEMSGLEPKVTAKTVNLGSGAKVSNRPKTEVRVSNSPDFCSSISF